MISYSLRLPLLGDCGRWVFTMHKDFKLMLDLMDRSFRDFENGMTTKPVFTKMSFGKAFRYNEKDIHQAIIQKLARGRRVSRELSPGP